MKIENILKWIGYSLIFIVLVGWGTYYRLSKKDESKSAVSTSSPTGIKFGVKQSVIINKIAPVEIEIFDGVHAAYILVSQVDADTPYIYHYNKGLPHEDKGIVPAYKDWGALGFTPGTNKPGLVKVELSLPKDAPMKSAELNYIIKKM